MKTSLSRVLVCLLFVGACDLEPGSIGDESQGGSETTDDTTGPSDGCSAATCGPQAMCVVETGRCTPSVDAPGTCQPTHDDCATIYAPVCGCDGNTYGNDCTAHAAGVNILHEGECGGGTSGTDSAGTSTTGSDTGDDTSDSQGDTGSTGDPPSSGADCDGLAGLVCPEGEFCYHDVGICFTTADNLGECRTIPENCLDIEDPVCACDNVTYGNGCIAEQAGLSLGSLAPCGASDEEKCAASGGTWNPTSCGHYDCGQPPECAAVIPGCDCGPTRNFYNAVGCFDDTSC